MAIAPPPTVPTPNQNANESNEIADETTTNIEGSTDKPGDTAKGDDAADASSDPLAPDNVLPSIPAEKDATQDPAGDSGSSATASRSKLTLLG